MGTPSGMIKTIASYDLFVLLHVSEASKSRMLPAATRPFLSDRVSESMRWVMSAGLEIVRTKLLK